MSLKATKVEAISSSDEDSDDEDDDPFFSNRTWSPPNLEQEENFKRASSHSSRYSRGKYYNPSKSNTQICIEYGSTAHFIENYPTKRNNNKKDNKKPLHYKRKEEKYKVMLAP